MPSAALGLTYTGKIRRYPSICVDNFASSDGVEVFLLTHCHTDHLKGLERTTFQGPRVLCSYMTKRILEASSKVNSELLVATPVNLPQVVLLKEEQVCITLIPSDHCPGSVMFLIQGGNGDVIFTGDTMLEPNFVAGLERNPFLLPYVTGVRRLHMLYFDSTFTYRGEPYIKTLSNAEGIAFTMKMMSLYPKEAQFYFTDKVAGFEEAWLHIQTHLGDAIHCSGQVGAYLKLVATEQDDTDLNKSDLYQKLLKLGSERARLHACGLPGDCSVEGFPVAVKQCINVSLQNVAAFFPVDISHALADGASACGKTPQGNQLYKYKEGTYILSRDRTELLPSYIRLPFSRHASYEQCIELVRALRPVDLYGCTFSKEAWLAGASMERLFAKKGSVFDKEMMEKYGPTANPGPVRVVDKWVWRAEDEFRFRGQYQRSKFGNSNWTTEDQSQASKTAKVYNLGKLFQGRHELKTKQLIRENRDLFEGRFKHKRKSETSDHDTPGHNENEDFLELIIQARSCPGNVIRRSRKLTLKPSDSPTSIKLARQVLRSGTKLSLRPERILRAPTQAKNRHYALKSICTQ